MSISNNPRPHRVLVVDDKDHARVAIKAAIGAAVPRCEFLEAENVTSAEKILEKERPSFDLAVIDLKLEELDRDGTTLLRLIKQTLHQHAQASVIIYTAYPTFETACAAYEAGASSYISKLDRNSTQKLQNRAKELLEQPGIRESLQRQWQAHRQADKAFAENRKNWVEKYGGKLVVVKDCQVIEAHDNPREIWKFLNDNFTPDERCDIAVIEIPLEEQDNA